MASAAVVFIFFAGGLVGQALTAASQQQSCSRFTTCESCLEPGTGCYGWQDTDCCSMKECYAASGHREFYTTCAMWYHITARHKECHQKGANDVCACEAAGCVAQEVGNGTGCFSEWQVPAGRVVRCSSIKESTNWCPSSPPQLCKVRCLPPQCPPGECAHRIARCCEYECQATRAKDTTL